MIIKSCKNQSNTSQTHSVSSSDGELMSEMSSTSNILSKYNTMDKLRDKRRKGAGAVSKKDNKKKSAKTNPAWSQTY